MTEKAAATPTTATLDFQAVRALRDICSQDATRLTLQYVRIRPDGVAEATSGYMAVRIPVMLGDGNDSCCPEAFVHSDTLKRVKSGDRLILRFADRKAVILPKRGQVSEIPDAILDSPGEGNTYPDLDSVWPATTDSSYNGNAKRIAFNGAFLKKLADAAGSPTNRLTFTIGDSNRAALVSIGGHAHEGGDWQALLMPLRLPDKD